MPHDWLVSFKRTIKILIPWPQYIWLEWSKPWKVYSFDLDSYSPEYKPLAFKQREFKILSLGSHLQIRASMVVCAYIYFLKSVFLKLMGQVKDGQITGVGWPWLTTRCPPSCTISPPLKWAGGENILKGSFVGGDVEREITQQLLPRCWLR